MMNTPARMWLGVAAVGMVLTGCQRSPTRASEPTAIAAAATPSVVSAPAAGRGAGERSVPAAHAGRAPGERSVSEALYDLTDVLFTFGCDEQGEVLGPGEGELVRMEGSVYERVTVVRDAAGGYHTTWHTMPVGLRGTGLTSGEEFRVTEREQRSANQTARGLTGAYRQELKLVGADTRRTFWIVWSGNYTITADDEVIVQRERERVLCRP